MMLMMMVMVMVMGGSKFKGMIRIISLLLLLSFHPKLLLLLPCSSLDSQGMALMRFRERVVRDPLNALSNWNVNTHHCSWFGVHCRHGNVVLLDLKDLCLGGTLAPELGNLPHIKSIILRNNSLNGIIPSEIGDLKELQVLDLGYNNFSGPVPSNLGNNLSLSIVLLDNNKFLDSLSPELNQLQVLSQHQVDENLLRGASLGPNFNRRLFTGRTTQPESYIRRSLLQLRLGEKPFKFLTGVNRKPHLSPSPTPSPSPSHSHSLASPSPSPSLAFAPSPSPSSSPLPSPASTFNSVAPAPEVVADPPTAPPAKPPSAAPPVSARAAKIPATPSASTENKGRRAGHNKAIIWSSIAGGSVFLIVLAATIIICRSSKMVTVKPWATGLSGQLQKAFVSGVPKLKRSELELACEDFSNIIGSLTDGIVYKGTLSSGVEIAVVSSSVTSHEQWSRNLEAQFRKKIETLSKVNHKNFVNLIGYCEEDKPFTRMMVFEYAPNGTLFEHLHIKEAERLDWRMRLRVVMGVAYCLEHMHQLNPPIPHRDLQSSAVYLADDYAAKISDFSFWNEGTRTKMRSPSLQLLEATLTDVESNVFNFGVVLLEIITGRMPYLEDNCSVADWVLDYLDKDRIPDDIIDPTLSSYSEEEVQRLFWIIRQCLQPDPKARPTMREVVARLREITGMDPDAATPKLSPLWWAELEVLSTEGN